MNQISATFRALGMLLLAVTVLRGARLLGEPTTEGIAVVVGTAAITGLVCALMLKNIRDRGVTFPFASACLIVSLVISVSSIGLVVVRVFA